MGSRFHLAIPAGDLDKAINFYCEILGCERGNAEFKYPDAWADINFWGNELTLHATEPNKKNISERHNVDMGNVTVPHFGVHLDAETFKKLKQRLIEASALGFKKAIVPVTSINEKIKSIDISLESVKLVKDVFRSLF